MVGIHHVDIHKHGNSLIVDDVMVQGDTYTHQQFEKRGKRFFMRLKKRSVIRID